MKKAMHLKKIHTFLLSIDDRKKIINSCKVESHQCVLEYVSCRANSRFANRCFDRPIKGDVQENPA